MEFYLGANLSTYAVKSEATLVVLSGLGQMLCSDCTEQRKVEAEGSRWILSCYVKFGYRAAFWVRCQINHILKTKLNGRGARTF